MAAGPPGQWASVIFVAAQVHTRVRFLFLSFSIYLSFFSLLKKNIYILFFHSNFSLIIFLTFSLFFFNFHLSSLLFLLNNFFSLYFTMIFLSLIIINFYLLSLSASVLPQTDNPTAAHQMLREGVF